MTLWIVIGIVLAYILGIYLLNSWLDYRKTKKFSFKEIKEFLYVCALIVVDGVLGFIALVGIATALSSEEEDEDDQ